MYGGESIPDSQDFPAAYSADNAIGSLTSHVMWTYPIQEGGIVGGNELPAGVAYFGGTAYDERFTTPIILDGDIYYTLPVSWSASGIGGPTVCQSLTTGQIIWSRNDVPKLSFGYVYAVWTPNDHGVYQGILFTANFAQAFDALTGDPLFNVTGIPAATTIGIGTAITTNLAIGPMGEQLRYVFANAGTTANPDWRLGEWNSSKLFFTLDSAAPAVTNMTGTTATLTGSTLSGTLLVDGSISNPTATNDRYDWNVSVPWLNVMGNQTLSTITFPNDTALVEEGYSASGSNPDASNPVTILQSFYGNMLLCMNGTDPLNAGEEFASMAPQPVDYAPYTYFAVNLNASRGAIGSILWMQTVQPPANNMTVYFAGADQNTNVFVEYYRETCQYVGYNLLTGAKIWGPTASITAEYGWDYYCDFSGLLQDQIAYGNIYVDGFAGVLFCYNDATGNLLWTYGNGGEGNSTAGGFNIVYGNYPTCIAAVGNGVIYTVTDEHTVTDPIYKGAMTEAINATNGQEIWSLPAFTGQTLSPASYAIADGYSVFLNEYDSQLYSVAPRTQRYHSLRVTNGYIIWR